MVWRSNHDLRLVTAGGSSHGLVDDWLAHFQEGPPWARWGDCLTLDPAPAGLVPALAREFRCCRRPSAAAIVFVFVDETAE